MKKHDLLNKAVSLLKPPHEEIVSPVRTVLPKQNESGITVNTVVPYQERELTQGDKIVLDFGSHYVGYFSMKLNYTGSHPDAPVLMRLRFAENAAELFENQKNYKGWICSSWIQDEQLHVDVVPSEVSLPRRYAFRFVEIEVAALSTKFKLVVESASLRAVSGADDNGLLAAQLPDDLLRLDTIACRTLHNCMQTVFEDGPKRDRRLWLGDLRLQALANYETYRDYDMVKACLYLFAALPMDDGRVSACLFLEPEPEPDDQSMLDYSLLFVCAVLDYYRATGDIEALRELSATVYRQIELAAALLGSDHVIADSNKLGWSFLDWNLRLNKQAGSQGVFLYAMKSASEIAAILGDKEEQEAISAIYNHCQKAANEILWDEEKGFYLSGEEKQLSWASHIWLILGGACEKERAVDILSRLPDSGAEKMVTPYMFHHYIEALISVDEKEKALEALRSYWGGMADLGADTFWELYDPENPFESPYGGTIVNSYCHAWSCAPAYFLRRYYQS